METKVRIRIITLGYPKVVLNLRKIRKWKSDVFRIVDEEAIELLPDTEGEDWEYRDTQLEELLPQNDTGIDVTVGIINAPLENNYYSRRLPGSRIVISLYDISRILHSHDIPIDNFVLRELYEFAVTFRRFGQVPDVRTYVKHDETRGCLFDMTPDKDDAIYSTNHPKLCEECIIKLKKAKISIQFIEKVENELKRIKKETYYEIADFVKKHPIISIVISLTVAFLINLLSSVVFEAFIATYFRNP